MSFFKTLLRPPGAGKEEDFLRRCVRCGRCVAVCPHNCITVAGGFGRNRHTPCIEPRTSPCPLCMKCPPACPTGALDAGLSDMRRVRMGRAFILSDRCHNYTDGTICLTCYDRCPLRSVAVVLVDGIRPEITSACVGCGICEYVCPVQAVEVLSKSNTWIPATAVPTRKAPDDASS